MHRFAKRRLTEFSGRLLVDRRLQITVSFLCAIVVALVVTSHVVALRSSIHEQTSDIEVLVAITEIAPGDALTSLNTSTRLVPKHLTPRDVLASRRNNSTAASLIVTGQMIGEHHVGTAPSLTPHGWKTVALPSDLMLPVASVGAKVDVVIDSRIVVTDAILVSVLNETRSSTIAVPEQHAPAVAVAAQRGLLTLVGA